MGNKEEEKEAGKNKRLSAHIQGRLKEAWVDKEEKQVKKERLLVRRQ